VNGKTSYPVLKRPCQTGLVSASRAASWHHDSESALPAPYVVFCATFNGTSYEGFDHEADVVLGYLASLVDAGLPGELAREGLRAYRPLWPDLFAAGWEQAYPKGFPDVELDPQYDLTLPFSGAFLHQAAGLRISGVGHGAGSPASGDFMVVADKDGLDELRRRMLGQYIIRDIDPSDYRGGPFGIPLERIEQARTSWHASANHIAEEPNDM
jgi:hypothetical protein